jgi:hypothetical protein
VSDPNWMPKLWLATGASVSASKISSELVIGHSG